MEVSYYVVSIMKDDIYLLMSLIGKFRSVLVLWHMLSHTHGHEYSRKTG